jgi:hypothetical protein
MTQARGEGCIEGWRCPECGNHDEFKVSCTHEFIVDSEGTRDEGGDVVWDSSSWAACTACGHGGTVAEFEGQPGKKVFQYTVPQDEDEDSTVRWIAADAEAQADTYAQAQGWQKCGGQIFHNRLFEVGFDFANLGVDVVLDTAGELTLERR